MRTDISAFFGVFRTGGSPEPTFTPTPPPEPSSPDNPVPANTAASVAITPLTYDLWTYDAGLAEGRNSAAIPVSGTATDNGATIWARFIRADNNAPVTDWQSVGTVQAGGAWTGTMSCPASRWPMRIEVAHGSGVVTTPADKRYQSGMVVSLWGQSWFQRTFNFSETTAFDQTIHYPALSVSVPDQVQIIGQGFDGSGAMGNTRRMLVRDSEFIVPNTVRFANWWASIRPGLPICIVVQARGATGIDDFMDDAKSNPASQRDWTTDDKPVYDLAKTDGSYSGLVFVDWVQNLIPLGRDISNMLHIFCFSELADGTPFQSSMATGGDESFVGVEATYGIDQTLPDLYDFSAGNTLLAIAGPHRNEYDNFDSGGSDDPANWVLDAGWPNATPYTSSAYSANPAALGGDLVRSAYAEVAQKAATAHVGLQMQNIYCSRDTQHPDATSNAGGSEDGDALWEFTIAQNLVAFSGGNVYFDRNDQPAISGMVYTDDYIEVSFANTSGPVTVTTTRIARGESQDPSRPAHHTQAMGFSVLGHSATEANIVNGKVRIGPLGGAPTVTLNDSFPEFGVARGGGQLGYLEDIYMQAYKDFLAWDKAGNPTNAEGKILVPVLSGSKYGSFPITNTLDVAPGASTRSDATTLIQSPGTLSALLFGRFSGDNQRFPSGTIEFRGTIPALPSEILYSDAFLFQISSSVFGRVDARDVRRRFIIGGGGITANGGANGDFEIGVEGTFRLSWNAATDQATITVPGSGTPVVRTVAYDDTAGGPEMNILTLMNYSTLTGLSMRYFKLWDTATADGTAPTTLPVVTISGGPEYLNVHPWKQGANVT